MKSARSEKRLAGARREAWGAPPGRAEGLRGAPEGRIRRAREGGPLGAPRAAMF